MKGKRTKIVAIMLCAALVMSAPFGIAAICLAEIYKKELSACKALSDGGISPQNAEEIFVAVAEFENLRTADSLFSLSEIINSLNEYAFADAAYAYQNPDEMPKGSVFNGLKYYKRIKNCLKHDNGNQNEINLPVLSRGQWESFFAAVKSAAGGVCVAGKEKLTDFYENAEMIAEYRRKLNDLSIKTVYNACEYVIEITMDINLRTLDFLDVFLRDGFYENAVLNFEPVVAALREITFEKFSDIVTYLPDRAAFSVACAQTFASRGAESVSRGIIYVAEEVFGKEFALCEEKLTEYIKYLIDSDPDALDGIRYAEADKISREIQNAFKILFE